MKILVIHKRLMINQARSNNQIIKADRVMWAEQM